MVSYDVVEDTEKTLVDLEMDFGTDVRNIVDGVTKLGRLRLSPRGQVG